MDNLEKLAQVTQNEENRNKNTTQYVLDTTVCNFYNIASININYAQSGWFLGVF